MAAGLVCSAQSAFPTLGGDVTVGAGSLSFTVGQVAVQSKIPKATSAEADRSALTEGVQQGYHVGEVTIDGVQPLDANVSIYPNPTTDRVTIAFDRAVGTLQLELYTVDGQLLKKATVREMEYEIDMGAYASGSYLLRLASDDSENNYRIIKVR